MRDEGEVAVSFPLLPPCSIDIGVKMNCFDVALQRQNKGFR
jgi:hypothetical protein